MRPSTPHVNAAFANMCIKNVYASKSCIQLAETRKETTLQICFPQAKFLNLEKKEMTLSFACTHCSFRIAFIHSFVHFGTHSACVKHGRVDRPKININPEDHTIAEPFNATFHCSFRPPVAQGRD